MSKSVYAEVNICLVSCFFLFGNNFLKLEHIGNTGRGYLFREIGLRINIPLVGVHCAVTPRRRLAVNPPGGTFQELQRGGGRGGDKAMGC